MAGTFKSLRGKLLLDGGKLRGSFFHRTVILICQHDAEGAFGLILNRPTETTLAEAVVEEVPRRLRDQLLHTGGPVQAGALSYLITDSLLLTANVLTGVSFGVSLETLAEAVDSASPMAQFRVFSGYAGWSPGQLDDEMKRGAWLTHPASVELVFDTPIDGLWKSILQEMGPEYRLLADAPEDPSVN